jgi:mono/diheme cytochrome c family protein
MRIRFLVFVALLSLTLATPVWTAKPVYTPPPPPMPEEVTQDDAPQKPAAMETPSRGQLLYENHCMGCHESVDSIRARRHVESLSGLRVEVSRWATYTNLPWGTEEVEEVVQHLNIRYYSFEK